MQSAALKDAIVVRAWQEAARARQVSRDTLDAVSRSAKQLARQAATVNRMHSRPAGRRVTVWL